MLESLTVENFTVFEQAEFKFGKNINVFIGENGTGKTHVLKLLYSLNRAHKTSIIDKKHYQNLENTNTTTLIKDPGLDPAIMFSFTSSGVFKFPLNEPTIIRNFNNDWLSIKCFISANEKKLGFNFTYGHGGAISNSKYEFNSWLDVEPINSVFIPAKEIVSLVVPILALSKDERLALDWTYNDFADLINTGRIINSSALKAFDPLLKDLQKIIKGKIEQEPSGKLNYIQDGLGKLDLSIVAEGWRKLATLGWLIYNGSITKNSVLFWDEPESNLNPKLIRQLARILVELSKQEIQIFLATHNLVLLKELDLILEQENLGEGAAAFFALSRIDASQPVQVSQGPTLSDVDPIVALDEELEQASLHLNLARQKAL